MEKPESPVGTCCDNYLPFSSWCSKAQFWLFYSFCKNGWLAEH